MPPDGRTVMRAADDHLRWVGEAAVVSMPAEIDVTNAGEVSARLSTAASHGPARLIIDMSETTFCDSVGVQAIIEAYNLVDAGNQRAANRTELRIVATAVPPHHGAGRNRPAHPGLRDSRPSASRPGRPAHAQPGLSRQADSDRGDTVLASPACATALACADPRAQLSSEDLRSPLWEPPWQLSASSAAR